MLPKNSKPKYPPILYHYCSNDALASILTARELWMTSVTQSNDAMEGKQASEILRQMGKADEWDVQRFSILDEILTRIEIKQTCYCSSFSSNGDTLSLWRGYGDGGMGAAIGFDFNELQKIESPFYPEKIDLTKVLYRESEQTKLLRNEYVKLTAEIEAESKHRTPRLPLTSDSEQNQLTKSQIHFGNRVSEEVNVTLARKLFTLKPRGFHEEKEWRLVQIADPMAKSSFRSRSFDIVPYRGISLSSRSIKEIILGPKNRTPDKTIKAMALGRFEDVTVQRSKLSYR